MAHHHCQQRTVTQKVWIQSKKAPNCHYYLQRAVTPDNGQQCPLIKYQGFFSRVENPSYLINSRLFLMNKKGWMTLKDTSKMVLKGGGKERVKYCKESTICCIIHIVHCTLHYAYCTLYIVHNITFKKGQFGLFFPFPCGRIEGRQWDLKFLHVRQKMLPQEADRLSLFCHFSLLNVWSKIKVIGGTPLYASSKFRTGNLKQREHLEPGILKMSLVWDDMYWN